MDIDIEKIIITFLKKMHLSYIVNYGYEDDEENDGYKVKELIEEIESGDYNEFLLEAIQEEEENHI